ncbi:MAG: 50S ribosome-binding GTPase [Alphaproteobacteria bacterium]|nr:50S ribosome-binding GTPase [Alphaproteobacteria bacterium]
MSSELTELLRKCHRDELLPLAEQLRIKHEGMKLASLASAIDARLRHAATHQLLNALRHGGRPPPYDEVLRDVGMRLGLQVPLDPELAELAIVRQQVMREWEGLPDEERARRWEEVAGEPPVPLDGTRAAQLLEVRHPQGFGLFLTRLVTEPVLPMPGCLLLLWLGRPRDELAIPAILAVSRLRQSVRHRVTVGIVGSPSSGKDAAMGAIFGMPTGNVNPVAGSTKEVEIRRLPEASALFVVNTPGMGDVVESVTEEARQVLDHIDVFVYLVNAQGGVQAREKADHAACVARRRPVLVVVNKVDTLRPADRDRLLEDCRKKLGVGEEDLLAAAFDPLPQLSETPIGVDEVREWLRSRLERLGKDPRELPWVS